MKKFYLEAYDNTGKLVVKDILQDSVWYARTYKTLAAYKTLLNPGMYKSFGYFKIRDAATRKVLEVIFKSLKEEVKDV